MRCSVCAQEISDSAQSCRHCGADLGQVPSANSGADAPLTPDSEAAAKTLLSATMKKNEEKSATASVVRPQSQTIKVIAVVAVAFVAIDAGIWWWSQQDKTPAVVVTGRLTEPAQVNALPASTPIAAPAVPDTVAAQSAPVVATGAAAHDLAVAAAQGEIAQKAAEEDKKTKQAVVAKPAKAPEKKVAVKKPGEVKRAEEAVSPVAQAAQKNTSDHAEPHVAAHAAAVSAPESNAPADWNAELHADLLACAQQSFFQRVGCIEKARQKHCPGHWGKTEECKESESQLKFK